MTAGFFVGTDVGGTFTDVWVVREDGRTAVAKVPTTEDVIEGIVEGLDLAASEFGVDRETLCARAVRFGHGTTVGLNALLTGSVPETAVLTTRGFTDTIEIGRLKRQYAGLNDAEVRDVDERGRWPPLVPRTRVHGVPERVDRDGAVVQPLDEDRARSVAASLDDAASVAICTLWSVQNDVHERRLGDIVTEEQPDAYVSRSSEVAPAVGEYGRMSTTAANAMLGPVMSSYFRELDGALPALGREGGSGRILAMTQAGGVLPAASLVSRPVSALLSGPAAAVIGGAAVGEAIGHGDVLTVDVGGTSFDAGLVVDGDPLMRTETTLAGAEIRFPSVDVSSIGAGGGSIASVEGSALTVGPESAAADPGPACYGRGGTRPTATDADLLLGVLNPDYFLGGRMPLDPEAAEAAVREHVADPLGMSVREAAWGIRRVLDSKMADLLRRVTVERGHDPRAFAMVACGGSGPSHAWALARELGIDTVVVPPTATVHSAYGTGTSDLRRTEETAVHVRLPPEEPPTDEQLAAFRAAFESVGERAREALADELDAESVDVDRSVAVRYRGQHNSLYVDYPDETVTRESVERFLAAFEAEYESLYGSGAGFREVGFELFAVRAVGSGELPSPTPDGAGEPLAPHSTREVVFDDPAAPVETTVYRTSRPAPGSEIEGPAIVEYVGHTAVVPPWATARTDDVGNLHLAVDA